jgi:subtilisin-like proprotein convertase family protein
MSCSPKFEVSPQSLSRWSWLKVLCVLCCLLVGQSGHVAWAQNATPTPIPMPAGEYIMYEKGGGLWATSAHSATQRYYVLPNGDDPEISPAADGKKVVFVRGDQIHVLNLVDGSVTAITSSDDFVGARDPAWSPDGTQIAFTGRLRTSSLQQIFVIGAAGGTFTQITNRSTNTGEVRPSSCPSGTTCAQEYTLEYADNYGPSWSPTGNELAFASTRHYVLNPGSATQVTNREIYRINIASRAEFRVTKDATVSSVSPFDEYPAWDRNGRGIAFESARTGNREIYIAQPDVANTANTLQQRTNDPSTDGRVAWSPTGDRLVWASGASASGSDGTILFAYTEGEGSAVEAGIGNKPSWGTTSVSINTLPLPLTGFPPQPAWAIPTPAAGGNAEVTGTSYPLKVTTDRDEVVDHIDFYAQGAPVSAQPRCVYYWPTDSQQCESTIALTSGATKSKEFVFTRTGQHDAYTYQTGANGTVGIAQVWISITDHTNTGALEFYLVAPDGSRHLMRGTVPTFGGSSTLYRSFTVSSVRGQPRAGKWKIEVVDTGSGTTGTWDNWGLTLNCDWELIGSTSTKNNDGKWQINWNTAGVHPGGYLLKAIAVATEGSARAVQTTVNVLTPQIQLTSPGNINNANPNNKVLGNSFVLNAKVTKNPSIVTGVDFYKSEAPEYYRSFWAGSREMHGNSVAVDIPDGGTGVETSTSYSRFNSKIGKVSFSTSIQHANVEQLRVSLVIPDGTRIVLFDRQANHPGISGTGEYRSLYLAGDSVDNLLTAALYNKPLAGDWRIEVQDDSANGVAGKIGSWGISLTPIRTLIGTDITPDVDHNYGLTWDTTEFVRGKYDIHAELRTQSEYTAQDTQQVEASTFSIKGTFFDQNNQRNGDPVARLTSSNDAGRDGEEQHATDSPQENLGDYEFSGLLRNRTYTVTPRLEGYALTPASRTYTINAQTGDITDAHFQSGAADSTPPTITLANAYSGGTSPTASGSTSDGANGSGPRTVSAVLWRQTAYNAVTKTNIDSAVWDGQGFSNSSSFRFEGTLNGSTWTMALPVLPAGKYELSVSATDNAGNQSQDSNFEFFVGNAIKGRITNSNNSPATAEIYLAQNLNQMDAPSNLPKTYTSHDFYDSSRSGYYEFVNVPDGTYFVVPRASGSFTPANRSVALNAANRQVLDANFTLGAPTPPAPPANDGFGSAQTISGLSGYVTGTNAGATKESGEPSHANQSGASSVWYRWTAPASGVAEFSTANSYFNSLLAVYTGASVNALTLIASNDDAAPGINTSRVTFNAVNGTTYYIAVDGYSGSTGSLYMSWALTADPTVNPTPLAPTLQLTIEPQIVAQGATTTGTLTLSAPQSAPVTVTLSSSDTSAATVPTSLSIPANVTSVPFTISAVDDHTIYGPRSVTITATLSGSNAATATVTVLDNDVPGYVVSPGSGLSTSEAGAQSTLSVRLSSQPRGAVTIPVLSSNTNEGTVDKSALVFQPDTWNVPQNITVTGVDDAVVDGNIAYAINLGNAQSSDPVYNGFYQQSLPITNADNDTAGLALSLSANTVAEGGAVTATLTRNTREPLTVNLSAPGALVPSSIVFAADVLSTNFTVQTQDDGVAAGNRSVTVSATAGPLRATQVLTLTDKLAPTLTLKLSATTIVENATTTVTGTLTRNTSTAAALSVALSSSDVSEARVPPGVTIPAGSTSVTFAITPADDLLADGTRLVTVKASATGFVTPATASLSVTDNEKPTLLLSIAPNRITETGTATATLKRNNEVSATLPALATSVVLNVAGQVTVPATVTIPKGVASVTFAVKAVNDTVADGPRTVTLTTRATGFVPGTADITVTDNEIASNGTLAGKVLLPATSGGLPVPGVTLVLRQGTALLDTILSASNGTYKFSGLPRGSYSVTPLKTSYAFAPASRAVTLPLVGTTTMNATGVDFIGTPRPQISGVLTKKDAAGKIVPLSGGKVVARSPLGNLQVTTSSTGAYLFDRLPLGTYAVAPLMPGSVFSPKARLVTLNAATPLVTGNDFLVTGIDSVLPALPIVKTPAANVTTATQSTLTATGTAADNTGGSGLALVTISIARFASATATTPNGYLNWSTKTFLTTDNPSQVEALATGTSSWTLSGPALTVLRALPAGFYGVRATAVDNAANFKRSTWKRFAITSTTRAVDDVQAMPIATSSVRLSTARAAAENLVLVFTGALDVDSATHAANFVVEVNGARVEIESISYASGTVNIGLPQGALRTGDALQVSWQNLRDATGKVLASPEVQLAAR